MISDGADYAFSRLGLQQSGQDRHGSIKCGRGLLDQIGHSLGHPVHFEAAEHNDDGAAGGMAASGVADAQIIVSRRHWPWARGAASSACGVSTSGPSLVLPSIMRCRMFSTWVLVATPSARAGSLRSARRARYGARSEQGCRPFLGRRRVIAASAPAAA